MRPELADALHRLRNLASVCEYNAAYVREHARLRGDVLDAMNDCETAAREIAALVRGMDALLG